MVPNQRQLCIVDSDWGSYLGSHFPIVFVGSCLQLVAFVYTSSGTVCLFVFYEFRFIKICGTLRTLRLGLIVTTIVTPAGVKTSVSMV
jgi:hypothetical protein